MSQRRLRSSALITAVAIALASFAALGLGTMSASASTTGTVSGTVTNLTTGAPVAGVEVKVRTGYDLLIDSEYITTTDVDGHYAVPDVAFGGTWPHVEFLLSGYGARNALYEALTDASPDRIVNYALPPIDSAIHGGVTDLATGLPISGASFNFGSPYDSAAASSDPSGSYEVDLVAGSYTIWLTAVGFLDARLDNVAVSSEENLSLDWSLIPADAEITGRVTDPADAGIPVLRCLLHPLITPASA